MTAPPDVAANVSAQRLSALLLIPVATAIAGYFALLWLPSAFYEGTVLPVTYDGLYHARRILDALEAPWSVAQFDDRIHAPEGSWVPWPWGFDVLMAVIARVLRDVAGLAPMSVLMFVPPAFLLANVALVVAITRALRLPAAAQWIAALAFAFSPLTQNLHGAGMLDHHVLELTCVLAALWTGLRWFAQPATGGRAAALGVVLAAANAVHNGLFLLQLPLVAAVALQWLRGRPPDTRAAMALAQALVCGTLVVALPSDAFRAGWFRFDLLSWFHVHVAALTSLAVLLAARLPCGAGGRARSLVIALLALAAAPLLREAAGGLSFVTADVFGGLPLTETRPPFGAWTLEALGKTLGDYGALIFLLPLVLLGSAAAVVRSRDPQNLYLCLCGLLGGLLVVQQYRFHQYGSFALYLLPLVYLARRFAVPRAQRLALLAAAAVTAAAHVPALPGLLAHAPAPGGSFDFVVTRGLYDPLAAACAERPGVVLADHEDGHHIRLLTDCAVIANNLLLTPESLAKFAAAQRLLALPAAELAPAAPWVRYLLVRREDNAMDPVPFEEIGRRNSALRRDLLLRDAWPPGYVLLAEVRLPEGPAPVLARVFEIVSP